ncbi:unnamed protein product [Paramecium sonneborni]|uniref:Transmembrane protein n=1 Tax=Paramecium sonneborni TaxID=65129 RepID=A0A8S1LQA2_9CILI|nr:unnamed protein product [Paramecium sonneborni]
MKIINLIINLFSICLSFELVDYDSDEITLYPTEGEILQYNLYNLLSNYENCELNPPNSFAYIIDLTSKISEIQGQQFKSLSSNNTHFAALSYENEVVIYKWKDQIMQQVGQSVSIDSKYNCFNINLFMDFWILFDCYMDNQLYLMKFIDGKSIIVNQSKSLMPISTKLQSIINETNPFIVYAQYYQHYSIISLLSAQFQNLSYLNNQFIDFDAPINTISPNIYISAQQQILQYSISIDSTFQLTFSFHNQYFTNFSIISVFYNYQTYPQYDNILVVLCTQYGSNSFKYIQQFQGFKNQIIVGKIESMLSFNFYFIKILQNNYFYILQGIEQIIIIEVLSGFQKMIDTKNNNNQLYINNNNQLFSFNQDIVFYQLSQPSLYINLTNSQVAGKSYHFLLLCNNLIQDFYKLKINLQVLFPNDTNIYVMFNQKFVMYEILGDLNEQSFFSFSGSLLNYAPNTSSMDIGCQQITYQNIYEINQTYSLAQLLNIDFQYGYYQEISFIGYNNNSIQIFKNDQQNLVEINLINISINAKLLQASYTFDNYQIIGISNNDTIYLFNQSINNSTYYSYNITFEQELSYFLLTQNNLIILFLKQEIQIMTFNFINTFTLNQSYINKHFKNVQFNPIQIEMNKQLQSTLLFINNINEVIIVSIEQNNIPIPIQLIKLDFQIKQISLVQQLLIISYICNNSINICFQVWNVQNLPQFFYVKSLYSLPFDNQVIIQSDNLFFYVTLSNQNVYVYNPYFSQHMSLYYKLELASPILCSLAIFEFDWGIKQLKNSLIFQNQAFYQLKPLQALQLTLSKPSYLDFNKTYPQLIYNFSVTSSLNSNAFYSTPNQSILLYSNFTLFNNQNYTINLIAENFNLQNQSFIYPINLIIDRQVSFCKISDQYNCNLTNQLIGQYYQNFEKVNYTLITSINNQFFALQNNYLIQIINSNLKYQSYYDYSNLNLDECLQSTSYSYDLYSVCQNSSSQYWLTFTLSTSGNICQPQLIVFPKTINQIYQISSIQGQIFILGNYTIEPNYNPNDHRLFQNNSLFWFNQLKNNFQIISDNCIEFSIVQLPTSNQEQIQTIMILFIDLYQQLINFIMTVDGNYNYSSNIQFEDLYYEQGLQEIQILETIGRQITYLMTDNSGVSFLLKFYCYLDVFKKQIIQSKSYLIQSIPNYGNLQTTLNYIYQNGIFIQQFYNNNYYIVGAYNLTNLGELNLNEPYLMQVSFNLYSEEYAVIVDQLYQNIIILSFDNVSNLISQKGGTQSLICPAGFQDNLNINVECFNEFSSGIYSLTFIYPQKIIDLQNKRKAWAISLLLIIVMLLIFSSIYIKYKTKNLNIHSEIEL